MSCREHCNAEERKTNEGYLSKLTFHEAGFVCQRSVCLCHHQWYRHSIRVSAADGLRV